MTPSRETDSEELERELLELAGFLDGVRVMLGRHDVEMAVRQLYDVEAKLREVALHLPACSDFEAHVI